MVQSCGDDALRPGALGPQLVHLLAGVESVFTHDHPVVGGCRDDDAQPAEAAEEEAAHLETRIGHGAEECVKRFTRFPNPQPLQGGLN